VRNRGELSEGWYDPATLWKAQQSELDPDRVAASEPPKSAGSLPLPSLRARRRMGIAIVMTRLDLHCPVKRADQEEPELGRVYLTCKI
jgi:hypothetical protein